MAGAKSGGRLCRQMMPGGKKDNYGEEREGSGNSIVKDLPL